MTEVDLEVFLMNDHKIVVRGLTIVQTEEVLEVSDKCCKTEPLLVNF